MTPTENIPKREDITTSTVRTGLTEYAQMTVPTSTSRTPSAKSVQIPNEPYISLYLISQEFSIDSKYRLDYNLNSSSKIQNIRLPDKPKIDVKKGQYVAIGFEKNSGSPYSVKRNEYSIGINNPDIISWNNNNDTTTHEQRNQQKIPFSNYLNKGAAFSFVVELIHHVNFELPLNNQPNEHGGEPINKPSKKLSKNDDKISKFQERDDILREFSIAEDYWEKIISEIKKRERMENSTAETTNIAK
ncbi:unnamed protein product [Didymodactylos carnosus]|uniref:Uncharacterized protein n=2 Tax=Didymodactylos carnosus TaxID=1234261 RepID=A0A8S2DIU4_9BILA|nr:unnamed protein product [Didymodactylos carnosus]CAF3750646.1 unnamed protein product [Didymodactylos carnosus]